MTRFPNKSLISGSGIKVFHPEAADLFSAPTGSDPVVVGCWGVHVAAGTLKRGLAFEAVDSIDGAAVHKRGWGESDHLN